MIHNAQLVIVQVFFDTGELASVIIYYFELKKQLRYLVVVASQTVKWPTVASIVASDCHIFSFIG